MSEWFPLERREFLGLTGSAVLHTATGGTSVVGGGSIVSTVASAPIVSEPKTIAQSFVFSRIINFSRAKQFIAEGNAVLEDVSNPFKAELISAARKADANLLVNLTRGRNMSFMLGREGTLEEIASPEFETFVRQQWEVAQHRFPEECLEPRFRQMDPVEVMREEIHRMRDPSNPNNMRYWEEVEGPTRFDIEQLEQRIDDFVQEHGLEESAPEKEQGDAPEAEPSPLEIPGDISIVAQKAGMLNRPHGYNLTVARLEGAGKMESRAEWSVRTRAVATQIQLLLDEEGSVQTPKPLSMEKGLQFNNGRIVLYVERSSEADRFLEAQCKAQAPVHSPAM